MKPENDKLYMFLNKLSRLFGGNHCVRKKETVGYDVELPRSLTNMHRTATALYEAVADTADLAIMPGRKPNIGFAASMTLAMDIRGHIAFGLEINPSPASWLVDSMEKANGSIELTELLAYYETVSGIKKEI